MYIGMTRVYRINRVKNDRRDFEIPAFLPTEHGKMIVVVEFKTKSNCSKTKQ